MTRRLRPPIETIVRCAPDGTPSIVVRGGRRRQVTSIASTWVRQPLWWQDEAVDAQEPAPLLDERTYYRLVLDELLVLEVFRVPSGTWYLERIID